MHGKSIETIRLVGGRLCLDAVNTAVWQACQIGYDFIIQPSDLWGWAQRNGLAMPEAAETAAVDVAEFRAVRRAIRALCLADATEHASAAARLDLALQHSLPRVQLQPAAGGLRFVARQEANSSAWLLGPLALSAVALLTAPERALVRACAGDDCQWLFLDNSRAGNRRWCSMASCGNRVKARTHYQAHRAAKSAARDQP